MTNDLPVSSSVITSMSPVVCTPVSLGAYIPVSPGVSAPVLSSVIKPESPCVPVMCLLVCHHCILLIWSVDDLILTIIFLFNTLMPLLVSLKFQMGWIGNLLVYKILAIHLISIHKKESKYVRDIRTLLISNERYLILSNAEQSTVHGEVECIQLKILDILHNHIKIGLLPGLAF